MKATQLLFSKTRVLNDARKAKKQFKVQKKYLDNNKFRWNLNSAKYDHKIIISLTAIPSRFENLHYVIETFLLQTMKPDAIILYLDEEVDSSLIPESLLVLKKYGVQIVKRPVKLMPHKKYYYAVKEHPDALVITIDDDFLYSLKMVETLYKTYTKWPDCVIAARAHKILFNKDDTPKKYDDWDQLNTEEHKPSMQLFATGCGCVLYPPHCMHADLLNIELIQKFSLRQDDIWLKFMQVLNGTKVVLCEQSLRDDMIGIPNSQKITLKKENVHKNVNDIAFSSLYKHYNLSKKDFI